MFRLGVLLIPLLCIGCGAVPRAATATEPSPSGPTAMATSLPCVNPVYPPAIGGLAYVTDRNAVLLFGGDDARNFPTAETWLLRSSCWQRMNPTVSPSARDSMTMAYDPTLKVVVLYGGHTGAPGVSGNYLYDT